MNKQLTVFYNLMVYFFINKEMCGSFQVLIEPILCAEHEMDAVGFMS